jgi:hypothetical protein
MNDQDSFLEVVRTIFPDAHNFTRPVCRLSSRVKKNGTDLRSTDFNGVVNGDFEITSIADFISKSLSTIFDCSYGKITITCSKGKDVYFHPLELLELSRCPELINHVIFLKKELQVNVVYPRKIINKTYIVQKSEI